ncbi:MAG: hypothetical protein GEU76_03385 [Alphaproteobacteria bacterium]|nr:hypothetical protein [Alphaproteobacteria bacterium]
MAALPANASCGSHTGSDVGDMVLNDFSRAIRNFFAVRSGTKAVVVLALLSCLAYAPEGWAQAKSNGVQVQQNNGVHAGEFTVAVNKSQILRLDTPFKDVSIGNAKIADVLVMSDRTIYILGKAIGSTSLTIFGTDRRLIAVADVTVTHDLQNIKGRLFELLPKERIEVRPAGDTVILAGMVSTGDVASRAVAIANTYAPGKVRNMLRVLGRQQVMLAVRFAEVERTAVKELGLNVAAIFNNGNVSAGINSFMNENGAAFPGSFLGTMTGGVEAVWGQFTLAAVFDALERKGVVKTLAEPNLIALSGDTADFLAGGEFPYRVINTDGEVGVEFKKFGVSLAFTPTVLDNSRINLVVAPESSKIDSTVETEAGAALSVRRASTTVELGDGQTFAIAGLLQNDFDDVVSQVPWLGDVPVLGTLFRSSRYQRRETELVILVTPRLVRPMAAADAVLPTDKFIPPSESDLFLMGKTETIADGRSAMGKTAPAVSGGLAGARGHIIE